MRDVPVLSAAEEQILLHPEDRFPADATPEWVDREQMLQGALVEREKLWIDPREVTGGED
jgi:hypothetical protein